MKILTRGFALVALLLAALLLSLKLRYGGGVSFPDRSTAPQLSNSAVSIVAELPWPPGNLSVDSSERIFFSFHPEAHPPVNLALWEHDGWKAFPSAEWQPGGSHPQALHEVLGVRLDRENRRLWALDNGKHGLHPPRILAFDADTGQLQHIHTFPREIAKLGSHYNDFQISPDGQTLYIADASFFGQSPALLVYEHAENRSRRVLFQHPSVDAERYLPQVAGRKMEILGLVSLRPGVDSIALSRDGNWLYFAPVTNNYLWRVRTALLRDNSQKPHSLRRQTQRFALKSMSDGIIAGPSGPIYLTDPEHFAIHQIDTQGTLETLVRNKELLRWPDGLSIGPANQNADDRQQALYITASGLHEHLGRAPSSVTRGAPWHILKVSLAP